MDREDLIGRGSIDSGNFEFVPDHHLIKECIAVPPLEEPHSDELLEWYEPGELLHVTQTAYLIKGEETLLFDTLSKQGKDIIIDNLHELLDGRDLDYLVISHPEANHAGNTGAIIGEFPEATIVAPARGTNHDLYGLGSGDDHFVSPGDTIDLGGYVVEFLEPIFYDHGTSIWMKERTTDTLFTVDFLGFSHLDGDCLKYSDEMQNPVTPNQMNRMAGLAFLWLRFADPDTVEEAINYVRETYDPAIVAPAHGQIVRTDIDDYFEKEKAAFRDITEQGTDYHIHTHYVQRFMGVV